MFNFIFWGGGRDRRNLAMALKDTRSVIGTLQAVIGIVVHVIFFFFYLLVLKVPPLPARPPLQSVRPYQTCLVAPGCPGSRSVRRRRRQPPMIATTSHPSSHFQLDRSSTTRSFHAPEPPLRGPGAPPACVRAGVAPGSHGRGGGRHGWPRAARARTSTPAQRMHHD